LSKDLEKRLKVFLSLFVLLVASYLLFDGVLLRLLLFIVIFLYHDEMRSLLLLTPKRLAGEYSSTNATIMVFGLIGILTLPMTLIALVVLSAFGYDVFAYMLGRKFGGKFTKSRPFPKISPNKTFEGLWLGLALSVLVSLVFWVFMTDQSIVGLIICLLGGIIACKGDLSGSTLKRAIGIKDSGEFLRASNNKIHKFTQTYIGGHGGIVDRFGSLFFTLTFASVINIFAVLLRTTGLLTEAFSIDKPSHTDYN